VKGSDHVQPALVATITLETYVAPDHKLREIRKIVNTILADCEAEFELMYSKIGRPSIAPEKLLRALLLMVLYTIPSERRLMEHIRYNLLFRWFVGLDADENVWDATVFTKNRDRLLEADIARLFFEGVRSHATARRLMSEDHFTVDGTLLEAWASFKSIRPIAVKEAPKDDDANKPAPPLASNPTVDFKGETWKNATHRSVTEPDARLARKGKNKETKLCFSDNVLMENRNGLVVDAKVLLVEENHEVDAALALLSEHAKEGSTVGADKLYDQSPFVDGCGKIGVIPHVAQNDKSRASRIDERTTREPGYAVSQNKRKRIEEIFGWMKTVGGLRKLRYRGKKRVNWIFLFCSAAFNIIRIVNIQAQQA
jgi:transposase